MASEPDNLILQHLRAMRAEIADVNSSVGSLAANFASDFAAMRNDLASMQKDTRDQIVGLRRAVIDYHTSVVGHGMLISEHEERLRRIERHLNLPAIDAH